MDMFSDEFIKDLPGDNALAIKAICDKFNAFRTNKSTFTISYMAKNHFAELIDAYGLLQAIIEDRQIPIALIDPLPPVLDDAIETVIDEFNKLCESVEPQVRNLTLKKAKEKYLRSFSRHHYEFSKGDVDAIKGLIKELRNKIESCKELDDEHRARAIKRLNGLDSEINIKMTSLNKAFVLIIEAQVLIHKLGEASKPYVQIIKRIVDFAWRAEMRAEDLSSDTCLILPKESKVEELELGEPTPCETKRSTAALNKGQSK